MLDVNGSVAALFSPAGSVGVDSYEAESRPLFWTASLAIVLCLLIVSCIVGNVMVLLAICWERDLRGRPQYYLIFSLAVADLIVGIIVTPLGAWSTLVGSWNLGVALCDFWISVDVLVCTASILHLVAIALDRYWSITDISYVQNRTPRRIILMLAGVWMLSLLISLAPFAGWKDDGFNDRVSNQHTCLISQQISYQVFSTATAFYIPLIAIICVYWKIMTAAKKRFKRERDRRTVIRPPPDADEKKVPLIAKSKERKVPLPPAVIICDVDHNGSSDGKDLKLKRENSSSTTSEEERTATAETRLDGSTASNVKTTTQKASNGVNGTALLPKKRRRPKESAENRRERKAWRTLAIITGTFIACWTPFFIVSLYRPLCQCQIPPALEFITAWLGYLNSALNPIIYTVFSQDFRAAFKRIIKRMCFVSL